MIVRLGVVQTEEMVIYDHEMVIGRLVDIPDESLAKFKAAMRAAEEAYFEFRALYDKAKE